MQVYEIYHGLTDKFAGCYSPLGCLEVLLNLNYLEWSGLVTAFLSIGAAVFGAVRLVAGVIAKRREAREEARLGEQVLLEEKARLKDKAQLEDKACLEAKRRKVLKKMHERLRNRRTRSKRKRRVSRLKLR
jgi:hypothetical protein